MVQFVRNYDDDDDHWAIAPASTDQVLGGGRGMVAHKFACTLWGAFEIREGEKINGIHKFY